MVTQRYELEAWLGDHWTSELASQIITEFQDWERAYPEASRGVRQAKLFEVARRVDADIASEALADDLAQLDRLVSMYEAGAVPWSTMRAGILALAKLVLDRTKELRSLRSAS